MTHENKIYSYIDINGNKQGILLNIDAAAEVIRQFGDVNQWIQDGYNRYILKFTDSRKSAFAKAIKSKAWQAWSKNLPNDF